MRLEYKGRRVVVRLCKVEGRGGGEVKDTAALSSSDAARRIPKASAVIFKKQQSTMSLDLADTKWLDMLFC